MKKIVALLLVLAMMIMSFASCGFDPDDKGAIIPLYLANYQRNLDPTALIYDKDTVKYTGLIYEGLTVIAEDGTIEKGLADNWYTEFDKEKGVYKMFFEIADSRWNDGRVLIADHFVYAWKRLLSPETNCAAASLLFDIKNAKAVKSGEMTIDDLGISSVDNNLLEITFEKEIDPELFLEAVASPALVPMRDDVIVGALADTWATSSDNISNNGQFTLKSMEYMGTFNVEKSTYYRTTGEEEVDPNKYVKPYKLLTDYALGLGSQLEAFKKGEIYYLDGLDAEDYEKNKDDLETQPLLSTYTYMFDCTNAILSDADVRKALSISLDRAKLAKLMGQGSVAATGLVSNGVFDKEMKSSSSFREEGGNLISSKANLAEAKKLLKGKTVSGELELLVRKNDAQVAVAEAAVKTWKELGIKVKVTELADKDFYTALTTGAWDIVGMDYQGLTTNAYSFLAPFARYYSGSTVSVSDESKGYTPHFTGFENDKYDAAIDKVLAATTRSGKNAALHKAEKLFVEFCPAAPIVFNYDYYLVSGELKGLESSAFGYRIFKDVTLKNYAEKNKAYIKAQKK